MKIHDLGDTIKTLNSLTHNEGLHGRHDVIQWDQVYDQDSMREYPIHPIVCVRGQMAVGKTKAILNLFDRVIKPETRCLVITYGILLASKYTKEFEPYGFKSYQDIVGPIKEDKVVICLDSLYRIDCNKFDYVIMDEAVSVLLHMNSDVMKARSAVSAALEEVFLMARQVYFLDACVDHEIVYDTVKYIETAKNVRAKWIKNTYLRPNGRKATATIATSIKFSGQLTDSAIKKVIDLLKLGKKVVVASNTKSFAHTLEEAIQNTLGGSVTVVIHTRDTDKKLLKDVTTLWKTADCLIYSPTVAAGISFEDTHFDSLVAYMSNGFRMPPVDLSLQQLFRVRNLTDGDMSLYISNIMDLDKDEYPINGDVIDNWLEKDARSVSRYYPDHSVSSDYVDTVVKKNGDSFQVEYDTTRLSYSILKGIISNKNKSLLHFSKILIDTLKSDYGIETDEHIISEAEEVELDDGPCSPEDGNILFTPDLVIDTKAFKKLEDKQIEGDPLSKEDLMKMNIYTMRRKWRVDREYVDAQFVDTFVCTSDGDNKKSMDLLYRCFRFVDALKNSEQENKERYKFKIDNLINETGNDFNIALYNDKSRGYFQQLIQGQRVMDIILGNFDKGLLLVGEQLVIPAKNMADKMRIYLEALNKEEFDHFMDVFRDHRMTRTEVMYSDDRKMVCIVKYVMRNVFGLHVGTHCRGVRDIKCSSYNVSTKVIEAENWYQLSTRYKSRLFVIGDGEQIDYIDR